MNGLPRRSSIALWVLAPLLLVLSAIRPDNPRSDRASRMPVELAGFELKKKLTVTKNMFRLLGTRDVAWWEYEDAAGNNYFMTVVFHDTNWKSLHPPHICIRGSDFHINVDREVSHRLSDGREIEFGHLVATEESRRRDYVSLYAFVGQDFVTPSYTRFYLHHAPRALLRRATSGFLMRVEAYVGRDGRRATEERCWKMFDAFLRYAESLIKTAE